MRDVASVTFPAYDGTDVSLRSELRSVENRVGVDLERLARILALQAGGQLDRDRAREGLEIIDTVRRRLEDRSGRLELMERELQLCKRRNRV